MFECNWRVAFGESYLAQARLASTIVPKSWGLADKQGSVRRATEEGFSWFSSCNVGRGGIIAFLGIFR